MRFGLRERIAAAALAASGTALVAVLLLVGPGLRARALDSTRDAIVAEARLMAEIVADPLARGASADEIDRIVDESAPLVRARVTIVALDGTVIADSELSGPALSQVENHGHRPEVQQALAGAIGSSVRHSATVGRDLLYAAVPITAGGRRLGVSRVAYSLAGIDAQARELRGSVAVALLLAFLVSAALAVPLSRPLLGPLREVMDSVRRFGAGDLASRAQVSRSDEIGELVRILNRSADLLQSRITELARERARTESVLSAMHGGVLAVDHAGFVLLANAALRRALDLEQPIGRHYVEVIRHPELGRLLEDVLHTGQPQTAELRLPRVARDYAASAVPFPGLEGEPHGAVATFDDVTERRRVEQIRRDFVANASHELRTPLTSIRGFVEALEDGITTEDTATTRRFLRRIAANADRMAALVSDLLELSRLEAGQRAPRPESLRLRPLVDELASELAGLAASKNIELRCEARDVETAEADPEHLRRILENLLDNALKYTPAGGHVELSVASSQDAVVFEVKDDGPGIAAEHQPRIFERFYRVDKARSRELGGTGLGLSIVKHLAEGMGGSVTVESEPGRGSRFRLRLPQPPRDVAAPAPQP